MPSKYRGSSRKAFLMPTSAAEKLRRFAESNDLSVSGLVASWAEAYVKSGVDYSADPAVRVEAIGDPATWAAAENRAREEYGVGFREIVMHEIAALDLL